MPSFAQVSSDPNSLPTVLVPVKDKSLRDGEPGGPPSLTVTARGGDRKHWAEEMVANRPNKEMRK